ncbi:MAG: helix-turn-helix transcriptional regulator, partial [Erysipelothrix sp.]|nr:helix-turn-helix transcriptional regulator [Erysipelothrix sp.]
MKELLEGLVLELRRGVLILGVLSQLNQKEYGYSLIQKLQDHQFEIEAGTLYP